MADRRVIPRTTGLILEMKASISWMTGAILANARVIPRMTGLIFGMKSVILGMKGAHPRDEGGYPRDDGRHPRDEGRLSAHLHPRAMAARAPRLLCSAGCHKWQPRARK